MSELDLNANYSIDTGVIAARTLSLDAMAETTLLYLARITALLEKREVEDVEKEILEMVEEKTKALFELHCEKTN